MPPKKREESQMWWSIAFTFFSAVIWLVAALVPIPRTVWIVAGAGGGRPSPDLDAVLRRLRLQSWLNAAAALSMFLAALLQLYGR